VPPLLLYAFISRIGTAFTFTFHAASKSVSSCCNTKSSSRISKPLDARPAIMVLLRKCHISRSAFTISRLVTRVSLWVLNLTTRADSRTSTTVLTRTDLASSDRRGIGPSGNFRAIYLLLKQLSGGETWSWGATESRLIKLQM
jgi:hypothetical protein